MTNTLLDDLRRIDPLPEAAEPPPITELLQRLDGTIRPLREPPRRLRTHGRRRPARPALAAAAVAGAGLAATLALSGLGGGRLDVAAAAYRATAGGSGVLHMTVLTERTVGTSTRTTTTQIWSARDPRRIRTIHTDSEETLEVAATTMPVRALEWSSSQPTVIKESAPANVEQTEATPDEAIHRLLGEGRATVVGETTYEGREAWQLQMHPQATQRFDGALLPAPTLIVAAHTFVPLELLDRYVTEEGGTPELAEQRERYTQYEELPATAQDEGLLALAPHPGATVQSGE